MSEAINSLKRVLMYENYKKHYTREERVMIREQLRTVARPSVKGSDEIAD